MARRQYYGAATPTTITSSITTSSSSVVIAAYTGWPTGSFSLVIDPGLSSEEKILATSQTTGTITFTTRGYDGTTASAHNAGAVIYPVPTAVDFDEANAVTTKYSATGDLTYASAANTPATLSIGATNNQLAVIGGIPAWIASPDVPKSTVTAKGDIITATASGTPSNLAVGSDGQTLVANSAATTGLQWASTPSASNPVLNSAMQVWQRGTSFAIASTTATYTADRWCVQRNATGSTISRQATGDTTNLPFIQYGLRIQRDSGNTSTQLIAASQSFESVNSIPFAGKTITVSFYAKAGANYSSASSVFKMQIYSGTGTDQNVLNGLTGGAAFIDGSATLTTTYQRFTFTGTVAATATQLAIYSFYTPVGTAGANDWAEITGVQIDIGSVALPFRTNGATLQTELAACQRYYWRTLLSSYAYAPLAVGMAISATTSKVVIPFPVYMRAVNSIDYASLNVTDLVNYTIAPTSVALDSATNTNATIASSVASGLTQYRVAYLSTNTANSGYLGFNGEL